MDLAEEETSKSRQVRGEAEQFPTRKLPKIPRTDPVEEEMQSLPVAHEVVGTWRKKDQGKRG